eukprot:TCALIF_12018-PA protein Name:"Similar to Eif4b Eukaryotic translation initiation factor 4B (Mus musculus)" AED:0.06 eAED:0.06 QI:0/0.5/0.61/0.76/0.41/0.53/13/359/661
MMSSERRIKNRFEEDPITSLASAKLTSAGDHSINSPWLRKCLAVSIRIQIDLGQGHFDPREASQDQSEVGFRSRMLGGFRRVKATPGVVTPGHHVGQSLDKCRFMIRKKGKKSKGKTIDLNSFLSDGAQPVNDDVTVVTIAPISSWADEMDEIDSRYSSAKPGAKIVLPTAPRAARGPDISDDRIPREPPFTAYVGNLSFESKEEDVKNFFSKLQVNSVRLARDGDRMRGYGYVDFEDRASLIEAFTMTEQYLGNRKIKVDVASRSGDMSGGRGGFRSGGSRYDRDDGEDRTAGDWRSGPRETPSFDRGDRRDNYDRGGDRDRDRGGFDRGYNSNNRSYSQYNGGSGYDRRVTVIHCYSFKIIVATDAIVIQSDEDSTTTKDEMAALAEIDVVDPDTTIGGTMEDMSDEIVERGTIEVATDPVTERWSILEPRERPKLVLEKRTAASKPEDNAPVAASSIFGGAKPVDTTKKEREIEEKLKTTTLEPEEEEPPKPSAASIFGGAKPVDTAAREREIEEKLLKEREQRAKDETPSEKGQRDEREDEKSAEGRPTSSTNRNRDDRDHRGGGRGGSGGGTRYEPPQRRSGPDHDRRDDRRDDRRGRGDRQDRGSSLRKDSERSGSPNEPVPLKTVDEKPPNFVGSNKFSHLPAEEEAANSHESE